MSHNIYNSRISSRNLGHIKPKANQSTQSTGKQFQSILKEQINKQHGVKFSKHATKRLEQRGIELQSHDMKAINKAVEKAKEKGARESLLLYKGNAFVVSVRNNTVITALDSEQANENIFTNIDSAIVWNNK